MIKISKRIQSGLEDSWVRAFLKILALLLFMGALTHLAGIAGLVGGASAAKPLPLRIADPIMLAFNLVVGWGLWRTRFWAVLAWIVGLTFLQVIPFTFFIEVLATDAAQRQALRGLMVTHALLMGVFFLLILMRGKKSTPLTPL